MDNASLSTWVSTEVVTASIMNTHVRDNFNETAPAKATGGTFIVQTSPNVVASRSASTAYVGTQQTTTSTSYTDLTTTGPSVSLTTGTRALVLFSSWLFNDTGTERCFVSVEVSNASTVTASNNWAIDHESGSANDVHQSTSHVIFTGLTAGTNDFELKYKVTGGTGNFKDRRISVLPA